MPVVAPASVAMFQHAAPHPSDDILLFTLSLSYPKRIRVSFPAAFIPSKAMAPGIGADPASNGLSSVPAANTAVVVAASA